MKSLWYVCLIFGLASIASTSLAVQGVQTFTIDGKLKKTGTQSALLDPNVKLEIQIIDPTARCLLYYEVQYANTATSAGYLNIQVGSGLGDAKRAAGDPGLTMNQIFSNATAVPAIDLPAQTCPVGLYTPSPKDGRLVRITVTPSLTGVPDTLADTMFDAVPAAMVAESADTIQGFGPAQLLRVNTTGTQVLSQSNLENIFNNSNYNTLVALLNGTSLLYNRPAANGTTVLPAIAAPTTPAAGQVWYDAGFIKYYDGSAVQVVGTGTASQVSAGAGSAATPSISFLADPDTGWYSPLANTLAAATGGVERVRIDASGRMGIGMTPTYPLDVAGNAAFGAMGAGGIVGFRRPDDGSVMSSIGYGNGGTSITEFAVRNVGVGGTIAFYTNDGTVAERMKLDNAGQLGIGVATPARILHIAGPMRINPTALPVAPAAGDLAFDSGDTNKLKYYDGVTWQTVGTGSLVSSFNSRTGAVVPAANDYTWAQIDKTVSSLADLATRSAGDLNSGTLADARLSSNVPLKNGTNAFTAANSFAAATSFNATTSMTVATATSEGLVIRSSDNSIVKNIVEIRDSANVVKASIRADGVPTAATDLTTKTYVDTAIAAIPAGVTSYNARTGAVVPAANDYTFAQIDKTTSSLADLTTRSAGDLSSGTLPDARLSANVPLKNTANAFTDANTVTVPTTTKTAIVVKSSDDNNTRNILEVQNNAGAVRASIRPDGVPTTATDLTTKSYVDTKVSTDIAAIPLSNYVLKAGDTMTGQLVVPSNGIKVTAGALSGAATTGMIAVDSAAGNSLKWYDGTAWQTVGTTSSGVTSFATRTGAVTPAANDYTFAQIDKTTSSLADLTTRSAGDLSSGTLPDARLSANVAMRNAANTFSVGGQQINNTVAGTKPLVLRAAAGQTATLTDWQNSAGTTLYGLDATGVPVATTDLTTKSYVDTLIAAVSSTAGVTSFNTRTGAVTPAANDYTFAQIDKTTSSLADLTTRSAGDLSSGTLPDARLSSNVPLKNAVNTFTATNTVSVATTTNSAAILKSTDDNNTRNILEIQNNAGTVKASIRPDGVPTAATDLTTKTYVDTAVAAVPITNYVLKTGDTMTGALVNNTNSASTALAITQAGAGYAATFMGGNVGIGTATPAYPLDLADGSARIAGLTFNQRELDPGVSWATTVSPPFNNQLFFKAAHLNAGYGVWLRSQAAQTTGMDAAGGGLELQLYANSAERLRITNVGNVGIGTSTPTTKLEVAGTIRVGDGAETCGASYTGGIRYNGGNLQFCNGTSWATLGVAGSGITALTGDVTASGSGSVTATIANDAVTFAKMANMNTAKIIGRTAAAAGDPEEIGVSSNLALSAGTLDVGSNVVLKNTANTFSVGGQQIDNAVAGTKPLVIRAAASQTATLTDWQNSAGTTLYGLDATGVPVATTDLTTKSYVDTLIAAVTATSGVSSFNSRTGAVVPATNDYTWAQINKATSSLADLTTRSAGDLSSGILLDARLSSNVPLKNTANTFTATNTVSVATTTNSAAILKSTDDNNTRNILEIQNNAGTVRASIRPDGVPTAATDLTTKTYVDTAVAAVPITNYVLKAGDTMTGALVNNTNSASTALAITQAGAGYAATLMGGNVGIGTTAPSALLSVGSTSQFKVNSSGIVSVPSGLVSGQPVIQDDSGNANGIYFNSGWGTKFVAGGGPALEIDPTSDGGQITFNNGSAGFQYYNVNSNFSMSQPLLFGYSGSNINAGTYDLLRFGWSSGSTYKAPKYATVSGIVTTGDQDFGLSFSTSVAQTISEKVRIQPNGNVGIGTTNPGTKLEVAGTIRVGDGAETCGASYTGGIRYNGGNLQFCNGTSWATLGVAGSGITALTGDVTASGTGSVAATIANDAVTFAKMANMNTAKIVGRTTAAAGDPEEIGVSTNLALSAGTLDVGSNVPLKNAANTFTVGGQQIDNTAAATRPLILKAAASQTASLTDWIDSTNAVIYGLAPGGVPTAATDLADKGYVDTAISAVPLSNYVLKAGDTMTGQLVLPGNGLKITAAALSGAATTGMLAIDSAAGNSLKYYNGSAWVSGGADNLGNHTATQNIALGNNWISNTGGNTGIRLDSTGYYMGLGTTPQAGYAFYGLAKVHGEDSGNGFAVEGISTGSGGIGVYGSASNSNAVGTQGSATGANSVGVRGYSNVASGSPIEAQSEIDTATVQNMMNVYRRSTIVTSGLGGRINMQTSGFTVNSRPSSAAITYGWEGAQTNDTTDRDGYLAFSTTLDNGSSTSGGTERMRISSVGNVGIGTSTPGSALDVVSNAANTPTGTFTNTWNNDTNYAALRLQRTKSGAAQPTAGFGTGIDFISEGTSDGSLATTGNISSGWEINPTSAANRDAYMSFATMLDGVAIPVEQMRITSAGNVGIGVTAPARLLHVAGPIRIAPTAAPASPATGDMYVDSTGGALKWYDGSAWQTVGTSSGGVTSFNSRTGAVVPASGDYTWAQITKTTSSLADIATRDAGDLSSGTLLDARLSSNVPLKNAANTFTVGGQIITNNAVGTVPLVIRGVASQTAKLQTWQDSAATVIYGLDITGVPTATTDLSTKSYVDTSVGNYVLKAGDTMTGTLNLPGNGLKIAAAALSGAATTGMLGIDSADANRLKYYNGSAWVALGTGNGNGDILNGGNTTGAEVTIGTNDANKLSFETGGAKAMTIATDGSVGIGTTAPATKLQIVSQAAGPNLRIGNDISSTQNLSGGILEFYGNYNGTGTQVPYGRIAGLKQDAVNGSDAGYLAFSTENGVGSLVEAVRINSGGNVGIGTTNPGYKLEVVGGINATTVVRAGNSVMNDSYSLSDYSGIVSLGGYRTTLNGSLRVNQAGGETISYINGGKFGINTGAPQSEFDVAGGVSIGSYGGVSAAPANGLIVSGNVGLGTTAPTDKLHVAEGSMILSRSGNNSFQGSLTFRKDRAGATVQSADELGYVDFYGYDGATALRAAMILANVDGTPGANDMPGRLTFWTALDGSAIPSERMRINNAGNVGIGTTSNSIDSNGTAYLMDVNGTLAAESIGARSQTGTLKIGRSYRTTIEANNGNTVLFDGGVNQATYLRSYGGSYPLILQDNSGNVGIGTTTPGTKLEVAGTIRVGDGAEICGASYTGGIRYNGGNLQFCNGITWTTLGSGGSGITALTGDVTATGTGSVAATIANDAVTFAKMQNINSAKIIGRTTALIGDPEEIAVSTNLALSAGTLDVGSNVPLKNAANTFTVGGQIITNNAVGTVPLVIRGVASQTAKLQTWQDSTSTILYGLDITGVPTATTDLSTKSYVDTSVGNYVLKAGDTMTGALNLPGNGLKIAAAALSGAATTGMIGIDSADANRLKYYNGSAWVALGTGNGNGDILNGGNTTGAEVTIGTNDAQKLNFETGNVKAITIDATGNVGIGNTAPTSKFGIRVADGNTNILDVKNASDEPLLGVRYMTDSTLIEGPYRAAGLSKLSIRTINNSPLYLGAHNSSVTIGPGPYDGSNAFTFSSGGILDVYTFESDTTSSVASAKLDMGMYDSTNNLGQLYLRPTTNGTPENGLMIKSYGAGDSRVGIGTTAPAANLEVSKANGSVNLIVGNKAATSNPYSSILLKNYWGSMGDGSTVIGAFTTKGTEAAPSPVTSGLSLLSLQARGYAEAGFGADKSGAQIDFIAANNWANSTVNTHMAFSTAGSGSWAPTERMRIKDNGNVGIGTTAPGSKLEIQNGQFIIRNATTTSSNVAQIQLMNDSASGAYPAIFLRNDVDVSNPAQRNKAGIFGYGGGFWGQTELRFAMNSSSDASNVDPTTDTKMTILPNGNIGIGVVAPVKPLHLDVQAGGTLAYPLKIATQGADGGGTATGILFQTGGGGGAAVDYTRGKGALVYEGTGGWNHGSFHFLQSSANNVNNPTLADAVMTITNTGNVGIGTTAPAEKLHVVGNVTAAAYLYTSDERLKKNIVPLDSSLEKILSLTTVNFDWRAPLSPESDRRQIGLIAQNVNQVYPEAISTGTDGFMRVNYPALIAPVIDAIRDLYKMIMGVDSKVAALETKVQTLEEKNRELEARLQRIENSLNQRQPASK